MSPHERLTAILQFLARGRALEDLKFSNVISPPALGKIITEKHCKIYKVLREKHINFIYNYVTICIFVYFFHFGCQQLLNLFFLSRLQQFSLFNFPNTF
jgi:hypothetical protein